MSIAVTAFREAWGTTAPFAVDNTDLDTEAEWARYRWIDGPSLRETLGVPSITERRGTLSVTMYTAQGEGAKRADDLVEIVKAKFEKKTISAVSFRDATATELPAHPPWYKVEVRIPFTYYEHK
jgi:hypothetical protein